MSKKVKSKRPVRPTANHGCPCPKCGARSRVLRTTIGERTRVKTNDRNFVVRTRICFGRARHRFQTEERPR